MARTKNHQISITLPEGWEDGTVFSFLGPQRSGRSSIITVSVDKSAGKASSLEEYAKLRSAQVIDTFGESEILLELLRKSPSGREVYEIAYRSGSGPATTFGWLAYMIENGCGYTLQCRSDRASRTVTGAAFRQVLESLIIGK